MSPSPDTPSESTFEMLTPTKTNGHCSPRAHPTITDYFEHTRVDQQQSDTDQWCPTSHAGTIFDSHVKAILEDTLASRAFLDLNRHYRDQVKHVIEKQDLPNQEAEIQKLQERFACQINHTIAYAVMSIPSGLGRKLATDPAMDSIEIGGVKYVRARPHKSQPPIPEKSTSYEAGFDIKRSKTPYEPVSLGSPIKTFQRAGSPVDFTKNVSTTVDSQLTTASNEGSMRSYSEKHLKETNYEPANCPTTASAGDEMMGENGNNANISHNALESVGHNDEEPAHKINSDDAGSWNNVPYPGHHGPSDLEGQQLGDE